MGRWRPLVVLGTAQFLMVLDTSVMNVSISQLVEDFDTEVTAIQGVITLYTLVMAAFMITGGKLGDMFGRRRMFGIGLAVYGVGSALTAVAPVLWVLALGWSIIEGLGAALVLPALAALVGGAYQGRDRAVAYGVIGGLAGAGIAVGPLLGGWLTTYATWRLVFVGEVVLVLAMLALLGWIAEDPPRAEKRPRLDVVGTVLSAAGLALIVLGVLQSSSWGWLQPRNPPFTVFGFSPTVFVIAAGGVLLGFLRAWENRLGERRGTRERDPEPLIRFSLFGIPPLRSGLTMLLSQNLILLGLFFVIPLYLQVVQGFDAFETGLRLLPVSVTMLLSAMSGPLLGRFVEPPHGGADRSARPARRDPVAAGHHRPAHRRRCPSASPWPCSASGMGLLASQLGNVVQSSVGDSERSEVGGLAVHRPEPRLLPGHRPHRLDPHQRPGDRLHHRDREQPEDLGRDPRGSRHPDGSRRQLRQRRRGTHRRREGRTARPPRWTPSWTPMPRHSSTPSRPRSWPPAASPSPASPSPANCPPTGSPTSRPDREPGGRGRGRARRAREARRARRRAQCRTFTFACRNSSSDSAPLSCISARSASS